MITQIKDKITQIFKKDFIIGLDIGTGSIKVAQFIKKEDGLHLVKADLREIKQSEDNALREQEIVSKLKDLFKGIDVKRSKIIVNINCPQTAIKKVITPYIPKAELRDGIMLEAKNYFPFPTDQSLLDFEILGDIVEKGVRKYEVLIAVSPKKTVDKYLLLLGKIGIKPDSFIASSYALQKIAESAHIKPDEARCFIDIGQLYTELIIVNGKHLRFSRKIPVAGNDFTNSMTEVLVSDRGKTQLSLDEAEKIKKRIGIPSGVESKIIDDKISTMQILSMIRQPLEQLVSEIERCFDYYREETGGGRIDSIVLFGGGSSLSGLIKYLSEVLGMEVRLGDSLEGLKIEKDIAQERDKVSHLLGGAVGAMLSAGSGINLLPPEIKEVVKKFIKRGALEAIGTTAILILVFMYIGMKIQLNNFQKRISVARLEISSLGPQLNIAQSQIFIDTLLVNEPYWEDVFKELSNLTPDYIHLTNFRAKDNVITIDAVAALSHDSVKYISDFILVLEKGIFNNVKLVGTRDMGERMGTEFELTCGVDYN